MKILHIATLFSPDGAYGGPTRVATNLSAELMRRGHDVTIAGACEGYDTPPTSVEGVPAWLYPSKAVPGLGVAGLSSPALVRRLVKDIDEFDVVHVHMSREFVTLPAALVARRAGVPYVLQTHGMIDPSGKLLARPLDAMATRPVLESASNILYLTGTERAQIIQVSEYCAPLTRLRNGVPGYAASTSVGGVDAASHPEVLYLARLHPRKRPEVFVRVARRLLDAGVRATFTVVGPDGGSEQAVKDAVAEANSPYLRYEGPVDPDLVPARIASSSVYVLPSVDEPYPMSVLEAMSVGRPVVITKSCGLAGEVADHGAGYVVDLDDDSLFNAIRSLLDNPHAAARMGRGGQAASASTFSMSSVVDDLLGVYDRSVRARRSARGCVA